MKKPLFLIGLFVLSLSSLMAADDAIGLWRGVDEKTGDTSMFTCIYEYQGKLYGRIVVTFDEGVLKSFINSPEGRAELWKGDPYYAGMDIIWEMEDRGKKWKRGNICDPKVGKIYACEIWRDGDNLIVRGKIGPFGRNQTWLPVLPGDLPAGFDIGDISSWIPELPELK